MKLETLFPVLGTAALLASCGRPDASSRDSKPASTITAMPGESSFLPLGMGQGLNPTDLAIKAKCVDLGPLVTQSGNSNGQSVQFRLLEIKSKEQLKEALSVSASASLKAGLYGGDVRASFTDQYEGKSESSYVLLHVRVTNQLEFGSAVTYTEAAANLIRQGASAEDFAKACGTHYVYGRRTGGEFFVLYKFNTSSRSEKQALSAKVSAGGLGWQVQASVDRTTEELNEFSLLDAKMYRVGGSGPLPDLENIRKAAFDFPTLVQTGSNGAATTFELLVADYDASIQPFGVRPNPIALQQQRETIAYLSGERDKLKSLEVALEDIKQDKRNSGGVYEDTPGFDVEAVGNAINGQLNIVNKAAIRCFEDIFTGCARPSDLRGLDFPNWPKQKSTCEDGYVWRRARPGDRTCVLPDSQKQAQEDNRQRNARRSPTGGDFGTNTCLQGWVWREAFLNDFTCVAPAVREATWRENAEAPFHEQRYQDALANGTRYSTVEKDVNRPGNDYKSTDGVANFGECRKACENDASCVSYVWTPGNADSPSRCWMKNAVPGKATPFSGAYAGVVVRGG